MKENLSRQLAGVLALVCFCLSPGKAQQSTWLDSAQIKVGTVVTVASQEYQPLWLVSNRWGSIADRQADVSSYVTFRNKHLFGGDNPVNAYLRRTRKYQEKSVSYGVSLYNNQLFHETFLQEGYVKLRYHNWQLAGGRYKEVVGDVDPFLSSGSMGISGNALPIPRISLGVTEFTDLPFIEPGWLQFKGQVSHGWMQKDDYVKNSMFHQRSFYLGLGRKPFKMATAYGGLNHFVIWGGQHPEKGQLWNEWTNLLKPIVPGNNLGFFDYGLNLFLKNHRLKAYTQVPFEGRESVSLFRIRDRLVGFSLTDKRQNAILSSVALELIHTTWMDVSLKENAKESNYNFYNDERYQTGWSYHGNIIGTPLFFDRQRGMHYFGENFGSASRYNWNIANNRIKGVHIAGRGNILPELHYRTMLTWTQNYGNYYNKEVMIPARSQWYFMQEFVYQYDGLRLNASLGCDMGELTQNVAGLIGVEYDFTYKPDTKQLGPVKFRRKKSSFRRRR